jgi:hypothetical protein
MAKSLTSSPNFSALLTTSCFFLESKFLVNASALLSATYNNFPEATTGAGTLFYYYYTDYLPSEGVLLFSKLGLYCYNY